MLDELEKLEEGKTLYDGELRSLYLKIESFMKMCYIFDEYGEERYYFKYKNKYFLIVRGYYHEEFYYLKRVSETETNEYCNYLFDLEDILNGVIRDDSIRERKERIDRINEELSHLRDDFGGKSLKKAIRI